MNKKFKMQKWGVITPGESFKKESKPMLMNIKELFHERLKIELSFGKHIYKKNLLESTSAKNRADDINTFLQTTGITGIVCGNGGFNSIEVLDYIDWRLLQRSNIKIFGSSDATVLINAAYSQAKNKVVSFHCPNLWRFGFKRMIGPTLDSLEGLMNEKSYEILPSRKWTDDKWYLKNEEDVLFRTSNSSCLIKSGSAIGTIIGGNLCSLNLLQGTKYFPDFKQDIVLFLEEDSFAGEDTFGEFSRNLNSLVMALINSKIVALVIGRFHSDSKMTKEKIEFITKQIPKLSNIPILYNVDISHTYPSVIFPIGGKVNIIANQEKICLKVYY